MRGTLRERQSVVRDSSDPILAVKALTKRFDTSRPGVVRLLSGEPRRIVHAVEEVSFEIRAGTTFALVGESGCGKSTIARCIAGILRPTSGTIAFLGTNLAAVRGRRAELPFKRNLQMIFQDPFASLNPRWRVGRIIAEPILTHRLLKNGSKIEGRIAELLGLVGLTAADARKFPHQFSGGQRQRISIARALASEPAFIICDEPTSALDVSVQAQILNLMRRLQERLGLTYLLITHNLAVVANMADVIGVMYLGRIVECGPAERIIDQASHPYTRLLLDTIPDIDLTGRTRQPLKGEVPSPLTPPRGCAFHPRCPMANERCTRELPRLKGAAGLAVACHAVEEGRTTPAGVAALSAQREKRAG
jgi:peptide/nickel transport system ATP-binding protein